MCNENIKMKEKDKGMVPINLTDFMDTIDKRIVRRGNKYYGEGHVNHLRQYELHKYSAMVHGTTIYYVDVELDDHNNIIKTSCTCPYQQGSYCKHQDAVFFELLKGKPKGIDKPANAKRDSRRNISTGSDATTSEELMDAKNTLLLHIRQGSIQGFINYCHMPEVLNGFYSILVQIENKLKGRDYEGSIHFGLIILPLIIDVSGYCDDSDGGVSDVVDRVLSLMEEATESGANSWDVLQKQTIFNLIIKESMHEYYSDMHEWRNRLLKCCVPLCELPDTHSTLETHIHQLVKEERNSPWVDHHSIEELLLILYTLIDQKGNREAANRFLEEHINYHRLRVLKIEQAFKEEDYLNVIRLCREGEQADKYDSFQDSRLELLQYRYEASRRLNNQELIREAARDLLLQGEINYYFVLKEQYSSEEWPSIIQPITDELSKSYEDVAIGIYIHENRMDQLLQLIESKPHKIVELYPYLLNDYTEEVHRLFVELIHKETANANNRKLYKQVCNKIKIFKKACGSAACGELIGELEETYRRRPALLDELEHIK